VSPGDAEGNSVRSPALRDVGTDMMCAAMYAAWIAGAREVCRAGARMLKDGVAELPLYKPACEYLRVSVLTMLLACAQEVVHVWSNTGNALCVHAVRYILGTLTDSVEVRMELLFGDPLRIPVIYLAIQDGEDVSWRYSEARFPALAMAKIALLVAYKSAQSTISHTAIESFPFLTQAMEDPKAPPPPYLAHTQDPAQGALFGTATLGRGQVAVQKRAREAASAMLSCATHLAAWRESHWRCIMLLPVVSAPKDAVEPQPDLEMGPVTYKVCGEQRIFYLALPDDLHVGAPGRMGEHCPRAG
jgi:hypothetical protein